jgi:phytoene synthase
MTNRVITLPESYRWCAEITQQTAGNFGYAFYVLPRAQQRAMRALYAFMRVTDDIADEGDVLEKKRSQLRNWREQFTQSLNGIFSHPVHPALKDIIHRYRIPIPYFHDVIDGVEADLEPVRFQNFDQLYRYCYRVASAVGLICIHIWGFRDDKAKEFAEAAGIALQLTNILRDLKEDLERGRIYLPEEDWKKAKCPPEIWDRSVRTESYRQLMAFQVDRAKNYYQLAHRLNAYLPPSGRAVFRIMMQIYREILEQIENRGYDVFSQRISIRSRRKISLLLLAFPTRWGWL